MAERPLPTDRDLLLLLKVEHVEQAVQNVKQEVQSLAPLLEKIIGLLAAPKQAPPPVARYAQLYPALDASAEEEDAEAPLMEDVPHVGGWGRLFPKKEPR